jgi:hypothetical protein
VQTRAGFAIKAGSSDPIAAGQTGAMVKSR